MATSNRRRGIAVAIAMVATAGLTILMTPTQKVADKVPPVNLESLVPKSFGDWAIDPNVIPLTVSPDLQAKIDQIYNQTLARTYVNSRGERIMLSIAYGGDQSESIQVHRPEVCYSAQGFQILKEAGGYMLTQYGQLPVKRLLAKAGSRNEPITYWVTVGDKAAHVGLEQKIAQLRYGLTGKIPDGMLVRVSTISGNEPAAYQMQESFVKDMLGSMDGPGRLRIAGAFQQS